MRDHRGIWLVTFEHCSDSDLDQERAFAKETQATEFAARIAFENADRCSGLVAAAIKLQWNWGRFDRATEIFCAEQELGGDCRLSIRHICADKE